tara:strand:+ start:500 stop:1774 length:1275 start_codon:yes stop_codon:yes gene_type:complete
MPVKKGLTSLANSDPNFSNQALENAINEIKAIDNDDGHQFILSQFLVDTAIHNNTVLTTSQKNDVLETLYAAQPHLQIGRYLNDLIRHTNTILDGTIMPITSGDIQTFTFLEAMQLVNGLDTTIPLIYGVPASQKSRSVKDHFGILNNMFNRTEDSTQPVFTRLKELMELIETTSRANTVSGLNLAITNAATANLNLRTFLASIRDDSTDFQTTLDNRVNSAVGMHNTLQTKLAQIPGDPTTDLVEIREKIVTQQNLEDSNIKSLRSYSTTVSEYLSYAGLGENEDLRVFLARVAQNSNWKTYFETYEQNQSYINPIFTVSTDSDKSSLIERVLSDSGLPDVTDATDFKAVADKAERDDRIDTAGFSPLTDEQRITKSCEQLGLVTANRSILDQSTRLLTNMNQHDRDKIAADLDLNESSETLS